LNQSILYSTVLISYYFASYCCLCQAFTEAYQIREKTNGKTSPMTFQAKARRDSPDKADITCWTMQ